jgi:hypothetical protein
MPTEAETLREALKSIIVIANTALTPVPVPTNTFVEEYNGDLRQWSDREPWQVPPGYQMSPKTYAPLPAGDLAQVVNGMLAHRLRNRQTPTGLQMCGSELNTRATMSDFVHGTIEGRFKIPTAAQAWPAFWMMGNNLGPSIYDDDIEGGWPETGEIDIFEFVNNGRDDGVPYFTVHWSGPEQNGNWGHYQKTFEWPKKLLNLAVPHTWMFRRSPDELSVDIDGQRWSTITRAELAAIGGNYEVIFNAPMHLRTTISSAGNEPGNWAYDPLRPAAQGDLLIEYIRVTKNG